MSRGRPPRRRPGRSTRLRRAELELRFWTARQALELLRQVLVLICMIAVTVCFVVGLIHGRIAGIAELLDVANKVAALLRGAPQ